ncbi:dynactin subunit 3 isoform X2 [Octopus sinensis]|uniref:Dynactin subunit 3 isoform X2 n=1 Tax=Octopus sinensis TaxID=2607531 RepID=A0A7E6F8N1_9MOLL|nr:dynactin subunit 3 isoform X2 [Octopus sinensis]
MAAISESDILEKRIGILESLVFGLADKDTEYPKFAQPETSPVFAKSTNVKCIDALNNVHSKINVSVAGRKNITETFNKLSDLQKYLDPEFTDELTITPSAKTEMILAEEDFIMQTASTMQKLKELEPIISSEHVKASSMSHEKMQELSQVHLNQQDQAAHLTDKAKALLGTYNSVITTLSKQFVVWDQMLTDMEIQAKPVKKAD